MLSILALNRIIYTEYLKHKEKNDNQTFTLYFPVSDYKIKFLLENLFFLNYEDNLECNIIYGKYKESSGIRDFYFFPGESFSGAYTDKKLEVIPWEQKEEKLIEIDKEYYIKLYKSKLKDKTLKLINLEKEEGVNSYINHIPINCYFYFTKLIDYKYIDFLRNEMNIDIFYIKLQNNDSKNMIKISDNFNVGEMHVFSHDTIVKIENNSKNNKCEIFKYYGESRYDEIINLEESRLLVKKINLINLKEQYKEIFEIEYDETKEFLLEKFNVIKGHSSTSLSRIEREIKKTSENKEKVDYSNYKIVNVGDMNDFILDKEKIKITAVPETFKIWERTKIKKYDILFSIRGSFKATIVMDDINEDDNMIIADNVAIVRAKSQNILENFKLFAFFQKKETMKYISEEFSFFFKINEFKIPKSNLNETELNKLKEKLEKYFEECKKIKKLENNLIECFEKI